LKPSRDQKSRGAAANGEKYAQAVEVTGKSYQSIADAKWVADRVELSRRRENLSWSHHVEVAALPAKAADRLLSLASSDISAG
jgi:hypothetical protein